MLPGTEVLRQVDLVDAGVRVLELLVLHGARRRHLVQPLAATIVQVMKANVSLTRST